MNAYLVAASVLSFLVGMVHSVLGERLIFRRLRDRGLVPTKGGTLLGERHVRILWATWHVVTVLGWGLAAILLWLAVSAPLDETGAFLEHTIAISMLAGAVIVLVGTKARHPGWVGLLGVAVLVWLGRV